VRHRFVKLYAIERLFIDPMSVEARQKEFFAPAVVMHLVSRFKRKARSIMAAGAVFLVDFSSIRQEVVRLPTRNFVQ